MPFLAEKVTNMLYNILKNCSPAELKSEVDPAVKQILEDQKNDELDVVKFKIGLQNKIQNIGKFSDVLLKMREN